jgi:hypothetical protein
MSEPSWEIVTTMELYVDGHLVGHLRERRGAFVQHVPLDRRNLRDVLGGMARRAANRLIKEARL